MLCRCVLASLFTRTERIYLSMYIFFMSLGCDKNLVDSEEMLGALVSRGFEVTDDESQAEVIVVNTCCFIHDAKEESIQAILDMANYKTEGNLKALIVTGCLAQRYKEEITKEIPEVDAVLGTNSQAALLDAVDEALKGKVSHVFTPLEGIPQVPGKRMITTGGFYEYLKIAEGCDKHCTYCIIPKIRGNYRSVPMETLIEQAKQLAEQGVKELILVAQETTIYGTDLYGKKSLHLLLKELCKIPGIVWIRVLYCYPEEIYPELIETIRDEKKICHYLDLPIQHASDRILKRMGRRTSKQQLIDIVSTLRKEIPDIVLRTTLITGFPGETQEDHEELMEFVDQMEFRRIYLFSGRRHTGGNHGRSDPGGSQTGSSGRTDGTAAGDFSGTRRKMCRKRLPGNDRGKSSRRECLCGTYLRRCTGN